MSTVSSIAIAIAALYPVYRFLCAALYSYLRTQYTVLDELENLGKPRSDGQKIHGTALIAGGSLAGLWTARVCADHFERVLVIDPDLGIHTNEDSANTVRYPEVKYVGEDRLRAPVNRHGHVAHYNSLHGKQSHFVLRNASYRLRHTAYQVFGLLALRKCFAGWDELFRSAGGLYNIFAICEIHKVLMIIQVTPTTVQLALLWIEPSSI